MRRFHCVEVHLNAAAVTRSETTARKHLKTVEFDTSIGNNRGFILNYGECYPQDVRISMSFVESTPTQRAKALLEEGS